MNNLLFSMYIIITEVFLRGYCVNAQVFSGSYEKNISTWNLILSRGFFLFEMYAVALIDMCLHIIYLTCSYVHTCHMFKASIYVYISILNHMSIICKLI